VIGYPETLARARAQKRYHQHDQHGNDNNNNNNGVETNGNKASNFGAARRAWQHWHSDISATTTAQFGVIWFSVLESGPPLVHVIIPKRNWKDGVGSY